MNQQGIEEITLSLTAIKDKLLCARTQKAYLAAQFNSLVYLYGQNAIKQDITAITSRMRTYLLGEFINTPVFAFRSKYDYKQSGKKYYIDLTTNKTYTRLREAKDCASQYCKNLSLILLEAS